jgi:hypothetical protein
MFVDIAINAILNGHPAELGAMIARSVSGTDPQTILPFQAAVAKYFSQHNMMQRQQQLSRWLTNPPATVAETAALNAEMQSLDRDLTRAFTVGGKKGKQTTFKSPYSPKVINHRRIIRYWKLWQTEVRTATDMYDQRAELFKDIDWQGDIPLFQHSPTLCQIHGKIRTAATASRHLLINAISEREKFLTDKSNYWALYDDIKAAKILKRMKHAEAAKAMFGHLAAIKGVSKSGSVTSVSIPLNPAEPTGACETIYDHDQVCQYLLERNKTHFSQSKGTDCTQPHVVQALGRHGEGGLKGLEGLDTSGLSRTTKQLFEKLLSFRLDEIDLVVEEDEVTRGFKHWREGTSTSPSTRDLSKYHAIFAPSAQLDNTEKELTDQERSEDPAHIGEKVAELITLLLNLCAKEGIALDRWLTVHCTMLQKTVGLRVIHIVEADLNLLLGILFGKRLTSQAEKNDCLGDIQWGSRKGKQCIDVILLKQLTYEIARMTRTDLTTFDNDAKSCYDRIVMSYALQRCQQLGMPVSACKMFGEFLDRAQYHVKTQLGVSKGHYTSTEDHPLHGPGQGV